ncbi:MAG TPA: tRNA lysidine(34) synthetase TilS [Caulobacteraceae bacterium]|nr:tRNA lysidine(34) synthetase TilS [Caulobacteraceae bacterium]
MRGLTAATVADPHPTDLTARAFAALERRLSPEIAAPVCVAVSGGGDSIALLALVCDWAAVRGRRALALSVDHRLQPDSAAWSRFAAETARSLGAGAQVLAWTGDKPAAGLAAAARAARHALLADAAREAGASVLLMAHTADDVAEGQVMRVEGSTLGTLREWAPSPAWPEGRGVFLLRPLLEASRAELRAFLRDRGLRWIEDPANADLRSARARARAVLNPSLSREKEVPACRSGAEVHAGGRAPVAGAPGALAQDRLAPAHHSSSRARTSGADAPPVRGALHPSVGREGEGAVALAYSHIPGGGLMAHRRSLVAADPDPDAARRVLAAAWLCAAGTGRPPRSDSVARLLERIAAGEAFAATLAGARIVAGAATVAFVRDAGEFARRGLQPLPIPPGTVSVWDGRFEIAIDEPGWSVVPLAGRMAMLAPADRDAVRACSPFVRPSLPLLIGRNEARPVLATRRARVRPLALERFQAACGLIAHEAKASVAPEPPATYVGALSGFTDPQR